MRCFPQLSTGAGGQYPLVKTTRHRTVAPAGLDSHSWKMSDTSASEMVWDLAFQGLSGGEWQTLSSFFQTCEGRLWTFTFLEPAANLLSYSEDLSQAPWQCDPLLTLSPGVSDPFETQRATRIVNASQSAQQIKQVLAAPADYHYCFSLYVRSASGTQITVWRSSPSASAGNEFAATGAWTRVVSAGKLSASDETISFGVELPSGASIDVFGLQVEAQPGVSGYRKTGLAGGVHSRARFLEDVLTMQADGPDQYSTLVRICSPTEE